MKIKLLLITGSLIAAFNFSKAQCTMTITPTIVFGTPGSYTIGAGANSPIQICSNVSLYDTSGNTSQRKYYLLPGANLIIKNTFSHFVYMQGNSTLTKIGAGGGSTFIYNEPASTLTGTFSPASTTCNAVSFPTLACSNPTTGIGQNNSSNLISIYPNPAKNQITLNNENSSIFNATLINMLGQKIRTFEVENGKNSIDISALSDGIYFINICDKNNMIASKKLIISK
jgi:hypothetical protein